MEVAYTGPKKFIPADLTTGTCTCAARLAREAETEAEAVAAAEVAAAASLSESIAEEGVPPSGEEAVALLPEGAEPEPQTVADSEVQPPTKCLQVWQVKKEVKVQKTPVTVSKRDIRAIRTKCVPEGTFQIAIAETDAWIKRAEDQWLPKQSLVARPELTPILKEADVDCINFL